MIIHTSRKRAIATAEIIAREIGFDGEFVLDERFAEQDAGEFSGKTLTEVDPVNYGDGLACFLECDDVQKQDVFC